MKYYKNSFLVQLVILLSLTSLSLSKKRDIVLGNQHLTGICLGSIAKSMPPNFCWKNEFDIGTSPTACPEGYLREWDMCFKPCMQGFESDGLFQCKETCKEGYTPVLLNCFKNPFDFYFRGVYNVEYYTNFNENVPCPPGKYKSLDRCYKDCNMVGMENCGYAACAIDEPTCKSKIIKMGYSTISGIGNAILFAQTFGLINFSKIADKLILKTLKKIGTAQMKKAMAASSIATKERFAPFFKAKSIRKAKETVQMLREDRLNDEIKSILDSADEETPETPTDDEPERVDASGITDEAIEVACSEIFDIIQERQIENAKTDQKTSLDADAVASSIEVLSFKDNRKACKDNKSKEVINCVRESMKSISYADTTGLLTLGSVFLHGGCDIDESEAELRKHTSSPPGDSDDRFLK